MRLRTALLAVLLGAALAACAPAPKRVERADQLPRFSYPVQGDVEALVRDDARFAALAGQVRRDVESVLAGHDIAETAAQRNLLNQLLLLDLLEGRDDAALRRAAQIQALQDKPADKLMSGMTVRAMVAATRKTGERGTPAWQAEVGRQLAAELERLPFLVVRNDVIRAKSGAETLGEGRVVGQLRTTVQPVVERTGALSSELVPSLISARYTLRIVLPLKNTLAEAYGRYLAANQVDKPDIWAARDVALPPGGGYANVPIVVWDSGVDGALFADRLLRRDGQPAFIAFNRQSLPSDSPLLPIPPELQPRLAELQARSKGLSDLTSNIDSAEAQQVKALLAGLQPAQYKAALEEIRLNSTYQHGTHVAGIAMAGNPYARLGNARIEFGHTLLPEPCPSLELARRTAANYAKYVGYIKAQGARVVNMSWGGNLRGYEVALEQCGIGADVASRRALAREMFDLQRRSLTEALASAPEVLFVVSAGNAANDPTFNENYPSSLVLPNVVAVGAVDKAGDEASFTSYGPTVQLHANGYQVDSYVPGGQRLAISGTSMAAPQVTNLAAKLLAVKPTLKPQELIALMRETADRSDDGRRTLIHPARALARVGYSAR